MPSSCANLIASSLFSKYLTSSFAPTRKDPNSLLLKNGPAKSGAEAKTANVKVVTIFIKSP